MADFSQYLDMPDAMLQQMAPGVDIAALKEAIRKSQSGQSTETEAKPVTQTIKTDPTTGEQTMTISGSPQDLSANNPLTPTVNAPVIPTQVAPETQPVQQPVAQPMPQPVQQPAPQQAVRPVSPEEAYNQYTQKMESGANPNIGYHNPEKSTAYGAYGLTAPQYQEIQRANPQFAGRDISTLSPQEQAQANLTSRDVYANQLRAKGVEPTEENLRLAHFLGAGGANQFLKTGAISPEAAAANGGEDRARQIAIARLNGPVNPNQPRPGVQMAAGGATSDVQLTPNEIAIQRLSQTPGFNPNAPTTVTQVPTWHEEILMAGNDPTKLAKIMAGDYPADAKNVAKSLIVQSSLADQQKADAQDKLAKFASGDTQAARDVMKLVGKQSEEGSYVKAVLFSQLGLNDLAKQEQAKLGGPAIGKAIIDGKSYLTETRNGVVVKAYDPTGKLGNDAVIAKINAEGTPQGTHQYQFTGETAIDPKSREEVRQVQNTVTGQVYYQYITGPQAGQRYTGGTPVAKSVQTAAQKEENKQEIQGKWIGPNASNRAAGSFAGEFNQKNGTNIGIREVRPGETIYVDNNTGRPAVDSQGNFVATQNPPARPAPIVPGTAPAPQAAAPAAPVAPGTAPAPVRVSPAASPKIPPMPQFREPGYENESMSNFETRNAAAAEANKKIINQEATKQYAAQNVYPIVKDINTALKTATGSGIGTAVDNIGEWFGYSTEGAKAAAQLKVLGDTLLKSVPRFEGPQSDRDVASYMAAAGQLADSKVPNATRAEAFKTIVNLNKKYAPDLDWSFKEESKEDSLFKSADDIIAKGKKK